MKRKLRWGPPGWPWELELLALIFVIVAIVVPYYLQFAQTPDPSEVSLLARAERERQQQMSGWRDLQGFFWALLLVGIYLAHLAIASSSIDFMSTPFTYLFSPLLFSMITYFRLFTLGKESPTATAIVHGTPLEILIWIAGVLAITFMVARLRMARYMLNFRNVDWEFSTPALFDKTYWELMVYLRPLVYPPRMFRASHKGILIEGLLYAMPVPFDSIAGMDAVQGTGFASSSYCLATSMKSLMRIQLADKSDPILISPTDRAGFLRYCEQRLAAKRPVAIPTHTTKIPLPGIDQPHRPGETRTGTTRTGE